MRTKTTNSNFEKRLLQYSAAAGTVLLSGVSSFAQVTGVSVNTTISTHGSYVDINFGGGVAEFRIIVNNLISLSNVNMQVLNGAGSHLWTGSGFLHNVEDLNQGAVIDNPAPHPDGAAGWRYNNQVYVVQGTTSPSPGIFVKGAGFTSDNKYIGVRFMIGGNLRYGWIKVKATDPHSLTVISYSYETTGSSITADGLLPVELTSFTGSLTGTSVTLNWNTATEVNNYGFDIERMQKQESESDNWEKIAFVEGHGNSNSPKDYVFVDDTPNLLGTYLYRLKQIDNDGTITYSSNVEVVCKPAPEVYELSQNYPNPFNPATDIIFALPTSGKASLRVYDLLGKEVATLLDEYREAGTHTVAFNASGLPSGTYFYTLTSGAFSETKKMMLLK